MEARNPDSMTNDEALLANFGRLLLRGEAAVVDLGAASLFVSGRWSKPI
ncbi:hypothetical protein [Streptomyces sp. NBC_01353]|nr:hypothetical protein [Streptomyces sp. NBC_01353]